MSPFVVFRATNIDRYDYPDCHGGYCDKKVRAGQPSRKHWLFGEGLCPNNGSGKIVWRSEKGAGIVQYYCQEHIKEMILHVFKDGVVRILNEEGKIVDKQVEELFAEKS